MYNGIQHIDVFISHASEDSAVMRMVVCALEASGLRCFAAPDNASAGGSYGDMLYAAIEKAPVTVVLISQFSCNSLPVARELELADRMNKRIVPVIIDGTWPTRAVAYYTAAAQLYNWNTTPGLVVQQVATQVALGPKTRTWF